jgi:hypothetical protein
MLGQLFFSIITLIIGIGLFPELSILWVIFALLVWLPAWLFFGSILIGLSLLIVM